MKKIYRVLLPVMACLAVSSCAFERIDAGHVGIRVNQFGDDKGVDDVVVVTGTVFYNPFTASIFEFPTFTQHKEYEPFVVNSKDASEFTVAPAINYYVNSEKVPALFKQYRKELPEIEDGFLKTATLEAYRIATNKYTADSLMSHREEYENLAKKLLNQQLESQGFILQQLTTSLTPPASLKAAIDAKNTAIQVAMQAENKIKQAEAEAKIKRAQAEGNAESLKIQADAEAYANMKRQQTLTPLLIQQQFLEKWNGQLPQYGVVPQIFKDISKE
jgi:regulator of protease activity HflC (stomatin/prohibitin superfamily)